MQRWTGRSLAYRRRVYGAERTGPKNSWWWVSGKEKRASPDFMHAWSQMQVPNIWEVLWGTTDKWAGYAPLEKDFGNLVRIPSGKKGSDFPDPHRAVMNLKGWSRGVHHHVNDLQDHLDEHCHRFNGSFMKEGIFDNLMARMVKAQPCHIKNSNA